MVRVVLDTNVFINANRGEFSYPKRILDLVRQGKIVAVITRSVQRENELIVNKLVNDKNLQGDIREFLALTVDVEPSDVRVDIEDKEDIKLLQAAVGGKADFLITDDRHLLVIEEYRGVKILTPGNFWQWWEKKQDETGHTWKNWTKDILVK